MSNEEAIKTLEQRLLDDKVEELKAGCYCYHSVMKEAHEKAIEALKFQQEYQDKVKECIKRIEKLKEPDFDDRNEAFNSALEESIYIIEQEI